MNCWQFVSSFFIITRVGIKECALLRQIAEGAWGKRIVQVFFFFIYFYLFLYYSFDAHGATSYYYFRNVLLCLHMVMSELAIIRKHFVPLL